LRGPEVNNLQAKMVLADVELLAVMLINLPSKRIGIQIQCCFFKIVGTFVELVRKYKVSNCGEK